MTFLWYDTSSKWFNLWDPFPGAFDTTKNLPERITTPEVSTSVYVEDFLRKARDPPKGPLTALFYRTKECYAPKHDKARGRGGKRNKNKGKGNRRKGKGGNPVHFTTTFDFKSAAVQSANDADDDFRLGGDPKPVFIK